MTRAMIPIKDLNRRAPEAGRIRLGARTAKAMKALDKFRFTSPHKDALDQLAEMYGGSVVPWNDPSARVKNQYELLSDSATIEVFLPQGGLSVWYEKWTGGGAERRCDGEVCEVAGRDEMMEVPCICHAKGTADCRPYTRLAVVLPGVDFYGTWRLESKGWNAAQELPGMYDMISDLAASGRMVRAYLHLEQRKSVANGKTKNFVTPTLSVASTPDELLAGSGTARPQLSAPAAPALNPAAEPELDTFDIDADVIDAEVVEDEMMILESRCRDLADAHNIDAQAFVDAVWSDTSANPIKIRAMLKRATDGKITPKAITPQGSVQWTTHS